MACFKVIQNNQIVDAGNIFLRWSTKWQQFFACELEEAQFAQSIKNVIYRDAWLRPCFEETNLATEAKIVCIDESEYQEIYELLVDEQIIDIPEEEYPIIPDPEPEVEPQKQKTVSEMREQIQAQQDQISMLTDCILELSEILYGGE